MRASNKHPTLHEVLHFCFLDLKRQKFITQIHFAIYDPERSINMLSTCYTMFRDHFIDSNIEVVLHDRVYVSVPSVPVTYGR